MKMAKYYIDPTAMDDRYLKVEGGKTFTCLNAPPWEEVEGEIPWNQLRPFYDGDERGFLAKCAADSAAVQEHISRQAL